MADLELQNDDKKETTLDELKQYGQDAHAEAKADDEPTTNLFGEVVEDPGQNKAKQGGSKQKKGTSGTVKPAAKTPEKVGTDYMVYYAGYQIPVPRDDMTIEEVRQMLEADYPELSKERTEMIVDAEKKQIVPVVKGAKKG